MSRSSGKGALAAISLTLLLPLGGCADYLNRMDVVSIGAGDAVRANREIHTVDPWPPYADDKTGLGADGHRAAAILEQKAGDDKAAAAE